MTEQFHLSRLQVINRGVFDSYHSIPFSAGGALIAGDNSGGEQEKLMAFCLAGTLSFNLASPESADNTTHRFSHS